ncbi:hypothetical protein BMS3Bbin16_00669 [archaeon BMS3Bbin16]|nr:hypothetical protein BMS3Bbin16_00669 [archaeon BMS3Bbin16]
MNKFCPFYRENCKGNECVMWVEGIEDRDIKCLIIGYLGTTMALCSRDKLGEYEPSDFESGTKREPEIPEEILSATAEELAAELLELMKKEFPNDERRGIADVDSLFWDMKGVDRYDLSPEIKLKIRKAQSLAQHAIWDENQIKYIQKLEQEKTELPSLVNLYADWAKERGFNKVTIADTEAFLLEKNLEVLPETRRSLYALTNVQLKSKY